MKIEDGPISEDACVVCREWPRADRAYLRWFIDSVPGEDLERICDACMLAFWDNRSHRPDRDTPPFIFPDTAARPDIPRR
jgi:hypothetical protein